MEHYILSNGEELFARLSGRQCQFFKIDLYDSHCQLELCETSKTILVVNTHRFLFRYIRLPFSIALSLSFPKRSRQAFAKARQNVVLFEWFTGHLQVNHTSPAKRVHIPIYFVDCTYKVTSCKLSFYAEVCGVFRESNLCWRVAFHSNLKLMLLIRHPNQQTWMRSGRSSDCWHIMEYFFQKSHPFCSTLPIVALELTLEMGWE